MCTVCTSKKRNSGATILVGGPAIFDVMVGANSRALRLAWRAESRRFLRTNPGVREAEKDQQRNRHLNPETRSREQSLDTFRQAAAREDKEVKEAKNEQRHNRRLVPEYREQEQSVNTKRQVIAHLDPEYRARKQFANTEI
jgi:hypothetical protein